jgi:hypothetical protein
MKRNSFCTIVAISWTAIQLVYPSGSTMQGRLLESANGGWEAQLLDNEGKVIAKRDCSAVPLLWVQVAEDLAAEKDA